MGPSGLRKRKTGKVNVLLKFSVWDELKIFHCACYYKIIYKCFYHFTFSEKKTPSPMKNAGAFIAKIENVAFGITLFKNPFRATLKIKPK